MQESGAEVLSEREKFAPALAIRVRVKVASITVLVLSSTLNGEDVIGWSGNQPYGCILQSSSSVKMRNL